MTEKLSFVRTACILSVTNIVSRIISPNAVNIQLRPSLIRKKAKTLLVDVFENFRDMALREYKLDPAHSWTVPGFAWNCALKISKAELELITDPETFLFC